MSELGKEMSHPSEEPPVQAVATSEPQTPSFFSKIRSIMTFGTSVANEAGKDPRRINPFSPPPPTESQTPNK